MAKRNAEDSPASKTRIVDLSLSGLTPERLRSRLLNAQQKADQLSKTLDNSRSEVRSLEARLRSSEARVQEQQEEIEAYMHADASDAVEMGRKYTETYQALEKMQIAFRAEQTLNESLQRRNSEKTRENFTLKVALALEQRKAKERSGETEAQACEDSASSNKCAPKESLPDSTRHQASEVSVLNTNSVQTVKPQESSVYSRLETGAVRKLTLVFPRDIVTPSAGSSSSHNTEEQGASPPTEATAPPLTQKPLPPTDPAPTPDGPSWLQWALQYVAIDGIPSYDEFLREWAKAEAIAKPTHYGIVKRPAELEDWVNRPSMASRFETERDPKFTTEFALTFPEKVQKWWISRQPAARVANASNRLPAPEGLFPLLDRWGKHAWVVIFVALKWWWQAIPKLSEGDQERAREQWKVVMEEMKVTFEHIVAQKKT
ncbi:hypothetical protein AAF712_011635 [Marasmius tenuissimus]|uniref:Uncharacterized protein n=1 Tax=Marasmius tenuissimus TaxID=585030 RepID=A0ABR2ZLF0_9AGAR